MALLSFIVVLTGQALPGSLLSTTSVCQDRIPHPTCDISRARRNGSRASVALGVSDEHKCQMLNRFEQKCWSYV